MTSLLEDALLLAKEGWPVFALNGKTPYRNCSECQGAGCKCLPAFHLFCHGFHSATRDPDRIRAMWHLRPDSNIGVRPSAGFFVLDVDPRHERFDPRVLASFALPDTRKAWSGREDGGNHLWFTGRRPKGKLGHGLDIKDWSGYVVAPPSLHPATGLPYRWEDRAAPILEWPARVQGLRAPKAGVGEEWMGRLDSVPGCWEDVLHPEGWTTNGRGDWLHPQASTVLSARVVDDLLYVFSTNTPFEPTSGGSPRGYNRIEAYALLNDISLDTFEGWTAVLGALS